MKTNIEQTPKAQERARLQSLLMECTPCEWGYNPATCAVALVLLSPQGKVLHANRTAARLLADSDDPGQMAGQQLRGFNATTLARMRAQQGASLVVTVRCAGERITGLQAVCSDAEPGPSVPTGSCWLHLMPPPAASQQAAKPQPVTRLRPQSDAAPWQAAARA